MTDNNNNALYSFPPYVVELNEAQDAYQVRNEETGVIEIEDEKVLPRALSGAFESSYFLKNYPPKERGGSGIAVPKPKDFGEIIH